MTKKTAISFTLLSMFISSFALGAVDACDGFENALWSCRSEAQTILLGDSDSEKVPASICLGEDFVFIVAEDGSRVLFDANVSGGKKQPFYAFEDGEMHYRIYGKKQSKADRKAGVRRFEAQVHDSDFGSATWGFAGLLDCKK